MMELDWPTIAKMLAALSLRFDGCVILSDAEMDTSKLTGLVIDRLPEGIRICASRGDGETATSGFMTSTEFAAEG